MTSAIDFVTPAQLAEQLGISERRVREMARRLGTCRIFGKTMVLLREDIDALMEAAKPEARAPVPPKSLRSSNHLPSATYRQRQEREAQKQKVMRRKRDIK